MRLLIAGGGTGGHIYPALAVARSLRAPAGAPELGWLGGHRGLEAGLVPRRRASRCRASLLRSLRSRRTATSTSSSTRSASRLSVPQALGLLARPAAGRDLHDRRLRRDPDPHRGGRRCGIPSVLWEGNVVPGRSVRARRAAGDVPSPSATARRAAPSAPGTRYVTGTPIRDARATSTATRPARGSACRPGERILLVFGGSQAVRRINDAVAGALPRLVERVRVVHVTGDDGLRARRWRPASALPEALRDRYRPYPFLRDEMTAALAAADLAVGRAGASTLAEAAAFALPTAIVPYPHAAGHQRAERRGLRGRRGARSWSRTRTLDADRLLEVAGAPRRPGTPRRACPPPRATSAGPGAAAASPTS